MAACSRDATEKRVLGVEAFPTDMRTPAGAVSLIDTNDAAAPDAALFPNGKTGGTHKRKLGLQREVRWTGLWLLRPATVPAAATAGVGCAPGRPRCTPALAPAARSERSFPRKMRSILGALAPATLRLQTLAVAPPEPSD